MRYTKVLLMFGFIAFFILNGCQKDTSSTAGSSSENGTLKILLTDAPASYDAVNITFSEIAANIDSNWVVVKSEPQTVNLLEWNNGKSIVLGDAQIPAGHYMQIRLMIDSAEVVVDGKTWPLTVPSGAQTGLKMGPDFVVEPGSTYELVIDFDVQRSIVVTGPRWNPHGYKLKPHLRVVPKAITGSISGNVTNPQNGPYAYAIQNDDTLASTMVDTLSGNFMLAYLQAGYYTVSIRDTADRSFTQDSVEVTTGQDKNIGSVTLQ